MYDAGHTVVGVEVAEQALKEFFIENKIEYTVEKLEKINGDLYKVIQRKTVGKFLKLLYCYIMQKVNSYTMFNTSIFLF